MKLDVNIMLVEVNPIIVLISYNLQRHDGCTTLISVSRSHPLLGNEENRYGQLRLCMGEEKNSA
jgi:hypothetical protein